MPADLPPRAGGIVGLTAVAMVVCCGLPVLLSVAVGVTIRGVGVRSWLVVVAGLLAVVVTVTVRRRRRSSCAVTDAEPERH